MPFFHQDIRACVDTDDIPQGNSIRSPACARYSVLFGIDNSGPNGERSRSFNHTKKKQNVQSKILPRTRNDLNRLCLMSLSI